MKKRKKQLTHKEELKRFLIPILRRATFKWKPRYEAVKRARVERGLYQCNKCGSLVKNKEFDLDHVIPVVSYKGFVDWNEYLERLFSPIDNWQLLCKPCHQNKTLNENSCSE